MSHLITYPLCLWLPITLETECKKSEMALILPLDMKLAMLFR